MEKHAPKHFLGETSWLPHLGKFSDTISTPFYSKDILAYISGTESVMDLGEGGKCPNTAFYSDTYRLTETSLLLALGPLRDVHLLTTKFKQTSVILCF